MRRLCLDDIIDMVYEDLPSEKQLKLTNEIRFQLKM
jgi:hypothetical protein